LFTGLRLLAPNHGKEFKVKVEPGHEDIVIIKMITKGWEFTH
jgi:hypothetical protein